MPMSHPTSYVYFIADGALVKIGTSMNPYKRLKQLQTGASTKLRMVAVVPGGVARERRFHERFKGRRVRGEWFQLTEDALKNITVMESDQSGVLEDVRVMPKDDAISSSVFEWLYEQYSWDHSPAPKEFRDVDLLNEEWQSWLIKKHGKNIFIEKHLFQNAISCISGCPLIVRGGDVDGQNKTGFLFTLKEG